MRGCIFDAACFLVEVPHIAPRHLLLHFKETTSILSNGYKQSYYIYWIIQKLVR